MLCRMDDLPVLFLPKMSVRGAMGTSPLSAKHLNRRSRRLSRGTLEPYCRLLQIARTWRKHPHIEEPNADRAIKRQAASACCRARRAGEPSSQGGCLFLVLQIEGPDSGRENAME